jgi:hypothetical protein
LLSGKPENLGLSFREDQSHAVWSWNQPMGWGQVPVEFTEHRVTRIIDEGRPAA